MSGAFTDENAGATHWPLEIRVNKPERRLEVDFDNGARFELPAEYLRVESPSAEVQGHSLTEKQVVPGKRWVGIEAVEAVGNYAIRIRFDDRHDTGLYSWKYLYELGDRHEILWGRYLANLKARGLSREPGGPS